jgi:hypothetical protein
MKKRRFEFHRQRMLARYLNDFTDLKIYKNRFETAIPTETSTASWRDDLRATRNIKGSR